MSVHLCTTIHHLFFYLVPSQVVDVRLLRWSSTILQISWAAPPVSSRYIHRYQVQYVPRVEGIASDTMINVQVRNKQEE